MSEWLLLGCYYVWLFVCLIHLFWFNWTFIFRLLDHFFVVELDFHVFNIISSWFLWLLVYSFLWLFLAFFPWLIVCLFFSEFDQLSSCFSFVFPFAMFVFVISLFQCWINLLSEFGFFGILLLHLFDSLQNCWLLFSDMFVFCWMVSSLFLVVRWLLFLDCSYIDISVFYLFSLLVSDLFVFESDWFFPCFWLCVVYYSWSPIDWY